MKATKSSKLLSEIIQKVESIRREHKYCEDGWYSCPKAIGGCIDESAGDDCNCGADDANLIIDEIIKTLIDRLPTLMSYWLDGFKAGKIAEKRKRNTSGCCCIFSDDDTEITELCEAHKEIVEQAIKKTVGENE